MTVYVVAALNKTDDQKYAEYVTLGRETLLDYPDARVAADDAPRLIEGELPANRFVLLKFKDDAALDEWYNSEVYQRAIPVRLAGSEMKFLVRIQAHD